MKRIPPWALVAGAVALGALFWLWKKRREQAAKETAEAEQQSSSEAPVVQEEGEGAYPYSIGGSAGGAGAIGNALESQSELSEIFKNESSYLQESQKQQGEFETQLAQQLRENNEKLQGYLASQQGSSTSAVAQGSGGGAPSEPRRGTTAAPTTPQDRCGQGVHAGFPNGTPPDCWRVSRTKSGGGCECHGHQNGQLECQRGKAPNCVW